MTNPKQQKLREIIQATHRELEEIIGVEIGGSLTEEEYALRSVLVEASDAWLEAMKSVEAHFKAVMELHEDRSSELELHIENLLLHSMPLDDDNPQYRDADNLIEDINAVLDILNELAIVAVEQQRKLNEISLESIKRMKSSQNDREMT